MNEHDTIVELDGFWELDAYTGDIVKDNQGNILNSKVDHWEGHNLITTSGKGLILDRIFGLSAVAAITACGVGDLATTAVVGDTQLGGGAEVLLQTFDSTATRASLVVTCVTTFATGSANFTWNELGLFAGTVNGTSVMLNRIAPIGPFTKTSAVSIVVTVTITQS